MNDSLITHLFVTQNRDGVPKRMEPPHLLPCQDMDMATRRFAGFLQKEFQTVASRKRSNRPEQSFACNSNEDYIPELFLCHYQVSGRIDFSDLKKLDENNKAFTVYLAEHGAVVKHDVPLRALEHLYHIGQESSLTELIKQGLINHLADYPDTEKYMYSQSTSTHKNQPSRRLTAVETAKGVLLFDYSGYGKAERHEFLQYIADHFHLPEGKSFEYVNLYKLINPTEETLKAFSDAPHAFSLYDGTFLPEKARYLSRSIIEGKHPWKSFDIKWAYNPHTECKYFIQDNDLEYNVITTQMQRLLSIKELGSLSLSAEERKNRIPFLHQKQFEQLFGEAKRLSGDGFPLSEDQRRKIVSTADRILQNYITDSLDKESEKQQRTLKLKI